MKTYTKATTHRVWGILPANTHYSEDEVRQAVQYLNGWRTCRLWDALMSCTPYVCNLIKEVEAHFPDQRSEADYERREDLAIRNEQRHSRWLRS